jgi:hypothetical protein
MAELRAAIIEEDSSSNNNDFHKRRNAAISAITEPLIILPIRKDDKENIKERE